MTRPRVLMIAPGCDGRDVGESWSCFQWVAGMSKACEVTLLTMRRERQVPAGEQLPDVEVVDWPELPLLNRFERFNSLAKPGYIAFYFRARRWMKKQLEKGCRFDLVHQVGPLALRYPSPAVGLGIPLIVGPLAGSLETPSAFAAECKRSPWYYRLRKFDGWRLRNDPFLRRTYSSAELVVGVAPYVESLLRGIGIRRFALASETGILDLPPIREKRDHVPGSFKMLFVGRLVRTKGLRDLIRAVGEISDVQGVTLDVAGSGEEEARCRAEAERLGVSNRIRFHGQISRKAVEDLYREADVFTFPSFREPSGNVVFEAMRHGLPVVTTDQGGPAYVVDDQSGIRLKARSPSQLAHDLAVALRRLARDRSMLARLSIGARQRVTDIGLWPSKLDDMNRLYQSVLYPFPSC